MKKINFIASLLSITIFSLIITSCSQDSDIHNNRAKANNEISNVTAPGQQELSLVQTVLAVNEETSEFSTLIAALVHTDLVGALDNFGQVTVFAPTDEAFNDLGLTADNISTAFAGEEGRAALSNILLYHLKYGRQTSGPVLNKKQIKMVNGGFIYPDASIPAITDANGGSASFEDVDIATSNAIIHIIGAVLIP